MQREYKQIDESDIKIECERLTIERLKQPIEFIQMTDMIAQAGEFYGTRFEEAINNHEAFELQESITNIFEEYYMDMYRDQAKMNIIDSRNDKRYGT